jgi:hypothetical protein
MAAAVIPAPPADRAPVAVPPAAAAPAVSPAAPPHPPAAVSASHGATVQLAALTTESSAREEWQLLTHRMPDLLNGRQPSFSRIERDGHVFWRVRTSGFADLAQAKAFCEHVRAKGAACTVADF